MAEPTSRATRPITLVLHVVAQAAADGRVAGRVEIVDTGETIAVRNSGELLALIDRLGREAVELYGRVTTTAASPDSAER